ncbi:DUF6270 domain-containing protein [Arthrobacter sp. AET 35A]|uniref:DUF6270 domain-containing protein n=1 Tax=Arthrobacter sp. AET 35A TaxID=2292643 RepID=UPI001CE31D10
MANVSIYGSCVGRTKEYVGGDRNPLNYYVARQSLISAFAGPSSLSFGTERAIERVPTSEFLIREVGISFCAAASDDVLNRSGFDGDSRYLISTS